MSKIIIVRMVPHFRHGLFTKLHKEHGWKVIAASNPPKDGGYKLVKEAPYLETMPFVFPTFLHKFAAFVPVGRIIKKYNPSIIIAEGGVHMSSTYTLPLHRLWHKNLRIGFWSHGYQTGILGLQKGFINTIKRFIKRFPLNRADFEVVYSRRGKNYVSNFRNPKTVYIAQNSLDMDDLGKTVLPYTPDVDGYRNLLYVGRLTASKNIEFLIEAMHQMIQKNLKVRLFIVGDGPMMQSLQKLAGNLTDKNIIFTGEIYDESELSVYFAKADLFVIPGTAGLSVNHSLAHNLPVLAFEETDAGPAHSPEIEYIQNDVTGYLVKGFNTKSLTKKLEDIVSEKVSPRIKMEKSLGTYVKENISLNRMAQVFINIEKDFYPHPSKNVMK